MPKRTGLFATNSGSNSGNGGSSSRRVAGLAGIAAASRCRGRRRIGHDEQMGSSIPPKKLYRGGGRRGRRSWSARQGRC